MGNVMREYARLAAIGLALSGAMGLFGAAYAADVYQRGGSLKDEPAPIVTPLWTGIYVGGSVGYGWGDVSNTFDIDKGAPDKQSDSPDSFLYGGFAGFNIQTGNFVFGGEVGLNGTDFDATTFDDTVKNHIDRYFTAVGRLGYAYGDWLFYGFGGAAWAKVKTAELQDSGIHTDEASHMGWTAGAGIERAFSDRFSVRLEYSHVDLGSEVVLKDDNDKVDVDFDAVKLGAIFKLTGDHPLESLK